MVRLVALRGRVFGPSLARVAAPKKVTRADYQSAGWKALRAARQKDADYRQGCRLCGGKGRLVLDHIIEIKDGGAVLEPGNTQWLCWPCHGKKTEAAKRKRFGAG